jgi:hypothetical protein
MIYTNTFSLVLLKVEPRDHENWQRSNRALAELLLAHSRTKQIQVFLNNNLTSRLRKTRYTKIALSKSFAGKHVFWIT